MSNIYQKLQAARVKLQKCNCKKNGKNTYSNYDYFELGDFLPKINEIMDELKICSLINYTTDNATLTLINSEKVDEQIVFSSPTATCSLKGAHDIQNLGAIQTYLRRYLYMAAFEIVESDQLDAVQGKEENKTKQNTAAKQTTSKQNTQTKQTVINESQYKSLQTKATKFKLTEQNLDELAKWKFNSKTAKELKVENFVEMINKLQDLWDSYSKNKSGIKTA